MDYLGLVYDEGRALGSVSESAPFAPDDAVAAAEQDRVVMFTDLVGFTKITAATGSRATGALLSRVLTAQIGIIESAGGTVGNIMGDAIMASWTIEQNEKSATCSRAVRAAFAIASAMRRVPSPLPRQQGLAVRIGLHVGPALLGTLAEGRASGRTLIGDTVNIAARLQQARGSGAAAEPMGSVRASAELYQELPSIQQRLLPVRSSMRACGRILQMHSGFRVDPELTLRHGTFQSVNARRAQRRRWNDRLDRLAECLVAA